MKRTVCMIMMVMMMGWYSISAQDRQIGVWTMQDIPLAARPEYKERASRFIEDYYSQLLININDLMTKGFFIESNMERDAARYMPEFNPKNSNVTQYLTPAQYLQELDKVFAGYNPDELSFEVSDIKFDERFYAPNRVSCYLIATYKLALKHQEQTLFSRRCRAYCLFPRTLVTIRVKLLQVEPVDERKEAVAVPKKDIISLDVKTLKNRPSSDAASTEFNDGDDFYLQLRTDKDISVAVFFEDGDKVFRLLPYADSDEKPIRMPAGSTRIFFNESPNEMIMTCGITPVTNLIHVVYSAETFGILPFDNGGSDIPETDRKTFERWMKETSGIQTRTETITIKK